MIFKRGNIFYFEFHVRGQRIRESTGKTTRSEALKAERDRRNELEGGGHQKRLDSIRHMLFPAAAQKWREANEANWSDSYRTIQDSNIEHLTAYFRKRILLDIGADDFGKYQTEQIKNRSGKGRDAAGNPNPISPRTVNIELSTLRMILKWAKCWRAIEDDVRMLDENKTVGKALERREARRLLAACRISPQPSLYTAVVVYANTALRNAELRTATWSQVDFDKAEFTVGKAKTESSTGRVVPLNKKAARALLRWKNNWPKAGPDDFIFPSQKLKYRGQGTWKTRGTLSARAKMVPYDLDLTKPVGTWKKSWATAQKAAGVKARVHDLRHHALTVMAEAGAPDSVLKAVAGHTTNEMMEHYQHARDNAKRKWMDALGESYTGGAQ